MAKLNIKPKSGSKLDASNLLFEITDLKYNFDTWIMFENISTTERIIIKKTDDNRMCIPANSSSISGHIDLGISDQCSQVLISILVIICRKIDSKNEVLEKIHDSFEISCVKSELLSEDFDVYPDFVNMDEDIKLSIFGKPLNKYVVCVNDRRVIIKTNNSGAGSIVINYKDIIGYKRSFSVQKYALFSYALDSDLSEKLFTGKYIYLLPSKISKESTGVPKIDITE